jgi:hypothetical protein
VLLEAVDDDDEEEEEEDDKPDLVFQVLVLHVCWHWRKITP